MDSIRKIAHTAGLFYLLVAVFGIFSIMIIPSQIIDWNSYLNTWDKLSNIEKKYFFNLLNGKQLLFIGVISGVICYSAFTFLAVWFYKLFQTISKFAATSLVILVFLSIPFTFSAITHLAEIIPLVNGGEHLVQFTDQQLAAKAFSSLKAYGSGLTLAEIFWGLWLFPFGYLVYKSGFIPKILGIALMLGCFYYLMEVLRYFLIPNINENILYQILSYAAMIGEMGTMLWLLIVGNRWGEWKTKLFKS